MCSGLALPKHRIRLMQRIYYEVEVEAETFKAAFDLVSAAVSDGTIDERFHTIEVDSGDYEMEAI